MLPLAFGKAFNALGHALGFIKGPKVKPSTKADSDNEPPSSPTNTEPLSGSPKYSRKGLSSRRKNSPKQPKVFSETARVYCGSSPKSYFRSQRAYEISRPFRMNPPRKLTRQPSFIIPKARKTKEARVSKKTKLISSTINFEQGEEDIDAFEMLPESPTRGKGKKRARDDEIEDLVFDEGNAEHDGPSAPKRLRQNTHTSNQVASSSTTVTASGRSILRSPRKEQATSRSLRSSMKGRSGTGRKVQRVHFSESVVFVRTERKRGLKLS